MYGRPGDLIVPFQRTPKVARAASSKRLDLCVEIHGFTPHPPKRPDLCGLAMIAEKVI